MGYQMATGPMTSRNLGRAQYLEARFRDSVPKDNQQELEMAYGLSNGHVTDDVT